MRILYLDFETRSALELKEVGLDNYVRHRTTKPLMLAWAVDDGDVQMWLPDEAPMPQKLVNSLNDCEVKKVAWNAGFERNVFRHCLGIWIPYEEWIDPMVYARYLSLPGNLDEAIRRLALPKTAWKIEDGKRLMGLFSKPVVQKKRKKATDENTLFDVSPREDVEVEPVFNDKTTHPDDWKLFKEYCIQDVVAERAFLTAVMKPFPLPPDEVRMWYLDQKINDAGMYADEAFAANSVALAEKAKGLALDEQRKLTNLSNPNSNSQMLAWVKQFGYPYNSLRKEPVKAALDGDLITDKNCRAVLLLRGESAKTSYTKLKKIQSAINREDHRLRNQFLFLGSARAGRWSGQDVQLHNMARPIKELEDEDTMEHARQAIYAKDYDALRSISPSVLTIVTSCIRSTFIAPPGKRLNVCDESEVETRVAAWFCGCEPLMQVYRENRSVYLDFASKMYQIPYADLYKAYKAGDKDAKAKRTVAKPAVLGCVYRLSGGGWGKNRYGDTIKTGLWGYAENMGVKMPQELAEKSVAVFREVYKEVKDMWYDLERAVVHVLEHKNAKAWLGPGEAGTCVTISKVNRGKDEFGTQRLPILKIKLPSGRCLHYIDAELIEEERTNQKTGETYMKKVMHYKGINQETKAWEQIKTHGGKLLENIVQAISRDVLANAMLRADESDFEIIGHVHDEIITLSDDDAMAPGLRDLQRIMSVTPNWAPGLLLGAAGYEGYYYKKG